MEQTDEPQSQPAGKKPSKLPWLIEKLGFPVLVAIVAAIITFVATYFWLNYNGRQRELRYAVTPASGLFQRPQMPGKDIKLVVDNRTVDNVSTVTISLFNQTDQDYDSVPLYVTFTNP